MVLRGTCWRGRLLSTTACEGNLLAFRKLLNYNTVMPELEERQARIEGILEQVDKRLTSVEAEIRGLHTKIDSNFKWQIGIMLTMWVTIIIAVLKKG